MKKGKDTKPMGFMGLPEMWLKDMGHLDLAALWLEGDSMEPVIKNGDLLAFDRKPSDPEGLLGHVVVIANEDSGEKVVKILFKDAFTNRFRVESFNDTKYPPTFVRQDLRLTFHRIVAANIRLDNYGTMPKYLPVFPMKERPTVQGVGNTKVMSR